MNNIVFRYNQESAVTAGESNFISESGAYTGRITAAKWVQTQNGAKGLELSFETSDGQKANYITVYHTKKDGTPNTYGQAHINAIMGLTGLQQLTAHPTPDGYICPELPNKPVGLILQKVLTTKQDGSESYKFELVAAFHFETRQTIKERVEQTAPERVAKIAAALKDKDERTQTAPQQQYGYASSGRIPAPPQRRIAPSDYSQPAQEIDNGCPF